MNTFVVSSVLILIYVVSFDHRWKNLELHLWEIFIPAKLFEVVSLLTTCIYNLSLHLCNLDLIMHFKILIFFDLFNSCNLLYTH